ncbi:MAG: 16S rRNA (uracil(1498)-N(3))-methyltransferase [Muribaculaceae bacterium]|nr:16S rRNA (uracil(1498)-N(3))-methyltransferase [Muribaculaceae bacterium]
MIRFYGPDIRTTCSLPEGESSHCVRVLRKHEGDKIEVVDGRGGLYRCTIMEANHKGVLVKIDDEIVLAKNWAPNITVAVAPTKHSDRMEWLIEKLVEIGVDRFVPLRCERSERKELKPDRLERIAISAMKQSLKAVMPQIDATTPLALFLKEFESSNAQKFVGYCDDDTPRQLLAKSYRANEDVVILIGPEGDFTPGEIMSCSAAGFVAVTMGDNRLRTETAALVATDTIHILNQALS